MNEQFRERVRKVAIRQAQADRLSAFIARYCDQIDTESAAVLAWPFALSEHDKQFLKVQKIAVDG